MPPLDQCDVLEHALRVVRHLDAEQLAHALVPGLAHVLRLERPLDQLPLEVEAEDDVQAVGRLVGLDADEAGLGAVDRRRGTSSSVDVAELVGERRLERLVPVRSRTAGCDRRGSPTSGSATRSGRATASAASGVRSSEDAIPCAYRPCPASCIVDQSDSSPVGW